MNRRTFLKLTTLTLTWLGLAPHKPAPTKAQTMPALPAAYGGGAFGQGPYPITDDTPPKTDIYLPLIMNGEK